MLTNLEDIKQRIIEGFDPYSIILFGSSASVDESSANDIDIFIVKDTDLSPVARRKVVEGLIWDRTVPVDIMVYTPREVSALFAMGSPFIEEIMEQGSLLYVRAISQSWLKDVKDELESAVILRDHGKFRGCCYHCQQCVEKALKALIIEKGERPQRSHDILQLRNAATALGWQTGMGVEDAVLLNSVCKGRYPTEEGLLPYGEPSEEDADRCLGAAQHLVDFLSRV
jgi:HEPN domain-containing protein/predicted nucleotidyltransferase